MSANDQMAQDPIPSTSTGITHQPDTTFAEIDGMMYKFTDRATYVKSKTGEWIQISRPNPVTVPVPVTAASQPGTNTSQPSGWTSINARDANSILTTAHSANNFAARSDGFFREANMLIARRALQLR